MTPWQVAKAKRGWESQVKVASMLHHLAWFVWMCAAVAWGPSMVTSQKTVMTFLNLCQSSVSWQATGQLAAIEPTIEPTIWT